MKTKLRGSPPLGFASTTPKGREPHARRAEANGATMAQEYQRAIEDARQ